MSAARPSAPGSSEEIGALLRDPDRGVREAAIGAAERCGMTEALADAIQHAKTDEIGWECPTCGAFNEGGDDCATCNYMSPHSHRELRER
jgi:hypothetical protein